MRRARYAALGVLLLLTATCVFGPLGTFTQRHYAYAERARLIAPSPPPSSPNSARPREECLALLFDNHRVAVGPHLVLALREDDAGDHFGAIDDETFEILTLELSRPTFGVRVPLDSAGGRLYYSSGGTAWASRCAGVFGTDAHGTVRLKRLWFRDLAAELDLVVRIRDAYHPDSIAERRIRRRITMSRSNATAITRLLTGA